MKINAQTMHMRKIPVNWMLRSVSIGYVLPREYELMQEYVKAIGSVFHYGANSYMPSGMECAFPVICIV